MRAPERARLKGAYHGILAERLAFEEVRGTPEPGGLAVVVCLWNRPGRIGAVLEQLDAQVTDAPLRLVLWNNNPNDGEHYRSAASAFEPTGAVASIEFFDSPHNIGGIGRFVAMRELVRRGYTGAFVMVDDDENISSRFVHDLLAHWAPRTIVSVWAWLNDRKYWRRGRLTGSGEAADHLGTGGSACDSALVTHESFFTGIPMRYLFMEDIWMSHCATRNGWRLLSCDSPVEFVLSELDQGHALYDDKEHFFTWLKGRGRIPSFGDTPVG
jgi:hypothetical protein